MKNDKFEDMLTEALREYVKDTEKQSEPVPKVKFSERHEKNMEKLFKSVADGDFGTFDANDDTENQEIKVFNARRSYIKYVKVAAFILLGLVASLAVAPSMTAWRKEDLDIYAGKTDEYAWGLNNNISERLEKSIKDPEKYMDKFGYLPEGFELKSVTDNTLYLFIEFNNNEKKLTIKIMKNIETAIDVDDKPYERLYINDKEIYFLDREDENIFIWNEKTNQYRMYFNFNMELNEVLKVIENIKYEDFEKNL